MDPLFQIADAVVADLESVKDALGTAFDVERNYFPLWKLDEHQETKNRKPQVFVSATVDDGEDNSRSAYRHDATIQILVGAYTAGDRGANDVIVELAADIARRYRAMTTPPQRILHYGDGERCVILNVTRPLVYDIEQLRAFGCLLSAINLTVRFDEEI